MSEFLVVKKKTVVDQPFSPAVPAVLDGAGVEIEPAIPEQPLITHQEYNGCYIETNPEVVIRALEDGRTDVEFYHVGIAGPQLNASLRPVNVKTGPRAAAPAREIVELEAGGETVGSTVVEV